MSSDEWPVPMQWFCSQWDQKGEQWLKKNTIKFLFASDFTISWLYKSNFLTFEQTMWLVEEQLEYALHKLGLNLESNEWVRGVECRLRSKGGWVGGRLVGGWKWTKYPAWGLCRISDTWSLIFTTLVIWKFYCSSLPCWIFGGIPHCLLVPVEQYHF